MIGNIIVVLTLAFLGFSLYFMHKEPIRPYRRTIERIWAAQDKVKK